MTLADLLFDPDPEPGGADLLVHFAGRSWTRDDIRDRADALAAALRGVGVDSGAAVGVMLPNGPSVWSGWPHIDTSSAAPALHASVSPSSSAPTSARLVAAMAAGEFLAIFSASSCASSRNRSGGSTTWLTMPSS